jgi:hypothetical protein
MGVGRLKLVEVSSAAPVRRHTVSDIYTTDHNRLPSVDCDAFGLTANVSGIKVWVILLQAEGAIVSCGPVCKGNLTTLRKILHLNLTKGNPKRTL